jgi:hypothetical protein
VGLLLDSKLIPEYNIEAKVCSFFKYPLKDELEEKYTRHTSMSATPAVAVSDRLRCLVRNFARGEP